MASRLRLMTGLLKLACGLEDGEAAAECAAAVLNPKVGGALRSMHGAANTQWQLAAGGTSWRRELVWVRRHDCARGATPCPR